MVKRCGGDVAHCAAALAHDPRTRHAQLAIPSRAVTDWWVRSCTGERQVRSCAQAQFRFSISCRASGSGESNEGSGGADHSVYRSGQTVVEKCSRYHIVLYSSRTFLCGVALPLGLGRRERTRAPLSLTPAACWHPILPKISPICDAVSYVVTERADPTAGAAPPRVKPYTLFA